MNGELSSFMKIFIHTSINFAREYIRTEKYTEIISGLVIVNAEDSSSIPILESKKLKKSFELLDLSFRKEDACLFCDKAKALL